MRPKPFKEMTVQELQAEWYKWDLKIRQATSWGAALAAADEFRKECELWLDIRGAKPPTGVPDR